MARRGIWMGILLVLLIALSAFIGVVTWLVGPRLDWWAKPNRVGVVEIRGVISEAEDVIQSLKDFREDSNIKAILLRIESPGGGVAPAQEIYREIVRTTGHKPVIASLGSVAASGGYYIASAADWIIASPGTLTGSIGVVIHFPNLKNLFEKIGYRTITIKSGQFKDSGNPGRDMTPEEKKLLQNIIDKIHQQFIRDVSKGRGLPLAKVEQIADGRILSGEDALQLGLIDALGNFEDAVDTAAQLGHIEGQPKLVYAEKPKRSLLSWILGKTIADHVTAEISAWSHPLRFQVLLDQ